MFAFGFMGLVLGAYLIDCAIQGRPPIATLREILLDPSNVQGVLATNTSTLSPAIYDPSSSEVAAEDKSAFVDASFTPGSGSSATGSAPQSNATGKAKTVIDYAAKQIGKPYAWGGVGPKSFDCSGLTLRAFQQVGLNIGRTTYQQAAKGTPVSKADLVPGDLVFPTPGHVQIYIGGGRIIEAPRTGLNVRYSTLGRVWKARRYF